jgi:hypothetical protein
MFAFEWPSSENRPSFFTFLSSLVCFTTIFCRDRAEAAIKSSQEKMMAQRQVIGTIVQAAQKAQAQAGGAAAAAGNQ